MLVAGGGAFGPAVAAAASSASGPLLVTPTLIAAVSDTVQPRDRAPAVGVYRFGATRAALGAVLAGIVADAAGAGTAIAVVAGLHGGGRLVVAATPWRAAAARLIPDEGATGLLSSVGVIPMTTLVARPVLLYSGT